MCEGKYVLKHEDFATTYDLERFVSNDDDLSVCTITVEEDPYYGKSYRLWYWEYISGEENSNDVQTD